MGDNPEVEASILRWRNALDYVLNQWAEKILPPKGA